MNTPDTTAAEADVSAYDVEALRRDFPILQAQIHGHALVYLDNAATTQKPNDVIRAMEQYYAKYNSNVHRGVHHLSQEATEAFEGARARIAQFINAPSQEQLVFVRGTTEGVNLVAQTHARSTLSEGDEVLITGLEHHSNIVPWQMVCEQTGATLVVAPIDKRGAVPFERFESRLGERTKIVAVNHISNALGTVNPVKRMIEAAHAYGAVVLVDGAQAAPHTQIDVQDLDADFYAFSGHKMYGPTGIGALYGKAELLERMPPYQGGGDMIRSVTFEKTQYNVVPFKFEAGTPNIAGAIGLAAAVDYLETVGLDRIAAHEAELLAYGTEQLGQVDDVRLIGTAPEKAGVISFLLDGIHPHDIGTILDQEGVAIRTGHHCAQPVMDHFGIAATARASVGLYNTKEEIDALVKSLQRVREVFA